MQGKCVVGSPCLIMKLMSVSFGSDGIVIKRIVFDCFYTEQYEIVMRLAHNALLCLAMLLYFI